jgi:hypothetical protein
MQLNDPANFEMLPDDQFGYGYKDFCSGPVSTVAVDASRVLVCHASLSLTYAVDTDPFPTVTPPWHGLHYILVDISGSEPVVLDRLSILDSNPLSKINQAVPIGNYKLATGDVIFAHALVVDYSILWDGGVAPTSDDGRTVTGYTGDMIYLTRIHISGNTLSRVYAKGSVVPPGAVPVNVYNQNRYDFYGIDNNVAVVMGIVDPNAAQGFSEEYNLNTGISSNTYVMHPFKSSYMVQSIRVGNYRYAFRNYDAPGTYDKIRIYPLSTTVTNHSVATLTSETIDYWRTSATEDKLYLQVLHSTKCLELTPDVNGDFTVSRTLARPTQIAYEWVQYSSSPFLREDAFDRDLFGANRNIWFDKMSPNIDYGRTMKLPDGKLAMCGFFRPIYGAFPEVIMGPTIIEGIYEWNPLNQYGLSDATKIEMVDFNWDGSSISDMENQHASGWNIVSDESQRYYNRSAMDITNILYVGGKYVIVKSQSWSRSYDASWYELNNGRNSVHMFLGTVPA